MTSEAIDEVKNDEAPEPIINEIIETTNEEQPTEQIKEEEKITEPIEQPKAKATPKKLARSVKVVELVECSACNKKMLPKSLRNTHPYYCKGQPTETLPVNKQKASYGTKVEEKLRKEIEEEIKKKYNVGDVLRGSATYESKAKEVEPTIKQSEFNEVANAREALPSVKTKPKPVKIIESEPKQLTATELIQQSYNELKRLRQQEKQEKINRFRASMF